MWKITTKRNFCLKNIITDFEPHSVVSIIQGTKKIVKKPLNEKKKDDKPKKEQKSTQNKINPMGIQMLSEKLSRQIFGSFKKLDFESETIEKYEELYSLAAH